MKSAFKLRQHMDASQVKQLLVKLWRVLRELLQRLLVAGKLVCQKIGMTFWRLFFLAISIGIAVWLGIEFGKWLTTVFDNDQILQAVKTLSSAGAAFALWKFAIDHGGNLLRFVIRGDRTLIRKPLAELSIAVVGVGVALGMQGGASQSVARESGSLLAMSFVETSGYDTEIQSAPNVLMLPIFSKNLDQGGADCTANNSNTDLQKLAAIDPGGKKALYEIACGLRSCSSGDHPVVIDVQGFASTAEFQGKNGQTCARTDEMNHRLAEMRRAAVLQILDDDVSGVENCKRGRELNMPLTKKVEVSPARTEDRWMDASEMERHRSWVDRVMTAANGQTSFAVRSKEILTRRVDIVIKNKGDCEGRSPQQLAQLPETKSR